MPAAIYARYSDEQQRPTSIDDQIRRARETAARLGYEVPVDLIFTDAAITGKRDGLHKRLGYKKLIAAWETGKFDALVVDEVSRLARDNLQLAYLEDRIERTGVRLLSTDGIDSNVQGWQLQFGMRGVIATHAVREMSHRVKRGMLGQLDRGFMIAAPPLGYKLVRNEDASGTKWAIDEHEAAIVREIFSRRRLGASLMSISRTLNEQGIPTPRPSRKSPAIRYWRPATVRQILANTIYRGLFVWHGSAYTRAKAKQKHRKLETLEFPRPELRIVEDTVWFDCNPPAAPRPFRGGGKQVFSGLVSCGICGSTLSVSTGGSSPTMHCAQCSQAKRVGMEGRNGSYVSVNGVKVALLHVMERMFNEEALQAFHGKLRQRLTGGAEERIVELKAELARKELATRRLLELLTAAPEEDELVRLQYGKVKMERDRLKTELQMLEAGLSQWNTRSIERQLEANPVDLLPLLFSAEVPAEKLRATLRRLFPKIVVEGKPYRYATDITVEVAPGVALAEQTQTEVIDSHTRTFKLRVTTGPKRPTTWAVANRES